MPRMSGSHAALLDALREMGIDPNLTRKVIIEITWDGPVKVYVEQLGDERIIGVVKSVASDVHVLDYQIGKGSDNG